MTGPFLLGGLTTLASCSSKTLATGMFRAADTFLKLLAMEDFLFGVKNCLKGVLGATVSASSSEPEDFKPADSFMAFSKTLTRSLIGEPV